MNTVVLRGPDFWRSPPKHGIGVPGLQNCPCAMTSGRRGDNPRRAQSFSIHGPSYHTIVPLQLPQSTDGSQSANSTKPPQFAQLYIHDGQHELDNRMAAVGIAARLDRDVLRQLQEMLHARNHWVRVFKSAAYGASPLSSGVMQVCSVVSLKHLQSNYYSRQLTS